MERGWFARLIEVIERDDRSYRAISLAANLGPNFVQQMIKVGKSPGTDKVSALLATFPRGAALYVVTGIQVSGEDLEFLREFSSRDPQAKKTLLDLLRQMPKQTDA